MPVWRGIIFEWDEEKAAANLKKHHIGFDEAMHVFDDVNRKEYYDVSHSDEEDRYFTIGMVRDILFVVYTDRSEVIRIISARKANEKEVQLYYDD